MRAETAETDAPEPPGGISKPPPAILASRMYANGGYFVTRGLFGEELLGGLSAEAAALRAHAHRSNVPFSDSTEDRGGSPARSFASVPGGALHRGLHGSPQLADALGRLCGVELARTGGGTYSYYTPPGDFLAVHRDVVTCDVAVITCLSSKPANQAPGALIVYPAFRERPLSHVRAAGRGAGLAVALERGDTVVLFGGITPHEVAPVECERIVAIMCYRVQIGEAGSHRTA
jgi:hypothetical protein